MTQLNEEPIGVTATLAKLTKDNAPEPKTCPTCHGSATVPIVDRQLGETEMDCPVCGGTGEGILT